MNPGIDSSASERYASPRAERRRHARHRLHSPVYASFKSPQAGMVVDLSELLDLSEDGFAVHTAEPLETGRPLALTLDLPETGSYIHGHGAAVWNDESGRSGVRFADLSDTSRRILREWLFVNLLVSCSNHAARTEQRSRQQETTIGLRAAPGNTELAPVSDDSARLSPMEVVRQKVQSCGEDSTAALTLITDCAHEWTAAGGAALALMMGDQMACRARSGDMAPPLDSSVDLNHGISGECVRTRQVISVEDTENDSRVDRETCRALGIGSILAVPIIVNTHVLGLLEVFSPRPCAFTKEHASLLHQLVDLVPRPQPPAPASPNGELSPATESGPESQLPANGLREALVEPESGGRRGTVFSRNIAFGLLVLALVVTATSAGFLVGSGHIGPWFRAKYEATASAAAPESSANHAAKVTSPEELRKLADAGDAEAQYWIGIRYGTGVGVGQNDAEAAKWFERAAEQGHVQAQARLGSYYWSGRGVPRDLSRAYFWASLALAQGDENSKLLLEGLSSQMTRSQVLASRQQADNWLHQRNQRTGQTKN